MITDAVGLLVQGSRNRLAQWNPYMPLPSATTRVLSDRVVGSGGRQTRTPLKLPAVGRRATTPPSEMRARPLEVTSRWFAEAMQSYCGLPGYMALLMFERVKQTMLALQNPDLYKSREKLPIGQSGSVIKDETMDGAFVTPPQTHRSLPVFGQSDHADLRLRHRALSAQVQDANTFQHGSRGKCQPSSMRHSKTPLQGITAEAFAVSWPPAFAQLSIQDTFLELMRPLTEAGLPSAPPGAPGELTLQQLRSVVGALVSRHPDTAGFRSRADLKEAYSTYVAVQLFTAEGCLGRPSIAYSRIRKGMGSPLPGSSMLIERLFECASENLHTADCFSLEKFAELFVVFSGKANADNLVPAHAVVEDL